MMNASWIKLMTLLLAVQALTAGMAQAQQVPLVPLKPLKDVLEPAAQLRGTWWNEEPQRGREHFTFGEKDELLVVSPQQQRDRMEYRLDTSKTPWKLILTVKRGEATGTIYAAIEFPAENQMRMSRAVLDEKQLPNAAQLKENGVLFHRVLWPQHGGIFQAVEAHLKGLEGTWQGITNGSTGKAIFTKDGRYTLREGNDEIKGRYRIDVTAVPCKIDMLPDDGSGPLYGIYEIKDGLLRCGKGARKADERVKDFEGAVEFRKEK